MCWFRLRLPYPNHISFCRSVYWICQKVMAKPTRSTELVRMILKTNCNQYKVKYIFMYSLFDLNTLILEEVMVEKDEKPELRNTSARGDMMWWVTIVAPAPLVTQQSRACHKKQEGKSTQFSQRFHPTPVKVCPAGFKGDCWDKPCVGIFLESTMKCNDNT